MQQNREWKLVWSWKGVAVQLCLAAAIAKMLSAISSDFYHLNWIASAFWFLALAWFAIACSSYNEESLKYFDGQSGRFQPRFQKRSRMHIFGAFLTVAIVFAVLGLFVQIYS